jgi:hypothetical protein
VVVGIFFPMERGFCVNLFHRLLMKLLLILVTLIAMFVSPMDEISSARRSRPEINRVQLNRFRGGEAENALDDPAAKRHFATGTGTEGQGVSWSGAARPVLLSTLPYAATSAEVSGCILAFAVSGPVEKTSPGEVYLFDLRKELANPTIPPGGRAARIAYLYPQWQTDPCRQYRRVNLDDGKREK